MPHISKEAFNISFIEVLIAPVINRFKSGLHIEIMVALHAAFEILKLQLGFEFPHEQLGKSSFHPRAQISSRRKGTSRSLCDCSSQEPILTRNHNLEEVVIVELEARFLVEVADEVFAVFHLDLSVPVFSQELLQSLGLDFSPALSVYSLERLVRLKFFHRSQHLSQLLYCHFFVRN